MSCINRDHRSSLPQRVPARRLEIAAANIGEKDVGKLGMEA